MDSQIRDDEIIGAYAAGQDVRAIASRFGLTPQDVERIVGGDQHPAVKRSGGRDRGNRIALGFVVGWVFATFARLLDADGGLFVAMWVAVGVATYALLGRDSSR